MIDQLFLHNAGCFADVTFTIKKLTVFSHDGSTAAEQACKAIEQALCILGRNKRMPQPDLNDVTAPGAQSCHIGCKRIFDPDTDADFGEWFWSDFESECQPESEKECERRFEKLCQAYSGWREWHWEAGSEPRFTEENVHNLWTRISLFPHMYRKQPVHVLWDVCRRQTVPWQLQAVASRGDLACHSVLAWMEALCPKFSLSPSFLPLSRKTKVQINQGLKKLEGLGELAVAMFRLLCALHSAAATKPRRQWKQVLLLNAPDKGLDPKRQHRLGTLLVRAAASGVQCLVMTSSEALWQGVEEGIGEDWGLYAEDVQHTILTAAEDGAVCVQECRSREAETPKEAAPETLPETSSASGEPQLVYHPYYDAFVWTDAPDVPVYLEGWEDWDDGGGKRCSSKRAKRRKKLPDLFVPTTEPVTFDDDEVPF